MKKIECITRPHRLDAVKEALEEIGVIGLTVTDVRGCGKQRGRTEWYRGAEYVISLLPKIKIELVVPEHKAEEAVQAICDAARTGEIGDGKIFVLPVEEAVRIRTRERGRDAL